MENIINFVKGCLSSKTAHGRVIRTLIQAVLGILAFLMTTLAIPEVQTAFESNNVLTGVSISTCIAVVSAIWNILDKFWESIKSE